MRNLEEFNKKLVSEGVPMQAPVTTGTNNAQQVPVQPQAQKPIAQPQQQQKPDPKMMQQKAIAKKAKMDQIAALKAQIMALQKELASM